MLFSEIQCILELGIGFAIFFLLTCESLIFCFAAISEIQMLISAHDFRLLRFLLHILILVSQRRRPRQHGLQYLTCL
jgi:hypothetical protein